MSVLGGCGNVFADFVPCVQKLEKKIPGAPANEVQVHERKRQIYAHSYASQ